MAEKMTVETIILKSSPIFAFAVRHPEMTSIIRKLKTHWLQLETLLFATQHNYNNTPFVVTPIVYDLNNDRWYEIFRSRLAPLITDLSLFEQIVFANCIFQEWKQFSKSNSKCSLICCACVLTNNSTHNLKDISLDDFLPFYLKRSELILDGNDISKNLIEEEKNQPKD